MSIGATVLAGVDLLKMGGLLDALMAFDFRLAPGEATLEGPSI